MEESIKVTIGSGHTRRIITFALWRVIAVDVVGESELSDGYYDRAWGEINRIYMLNAEPGGAETRLLRLATLTAAVRSVATAADGACVELPVTPSEVADALRDCVRAIDLGDDLFLALPESERADVLGCRRAAIRLLRSIEVPTAGPDRLTATCAPLPGTSTSAAPGF